MDAAVTEVVEVKVMRRVDSDHVHRPRQCPAYNQSCNYCHRVGHFVRRCYPQRSVHYAANEYGGQGYEYTLNIHMVTQDVHVANRQKSMWSVDLSTKCDGYISFKIDTGAECSLISKATYESMFDKPVLFQSNIAVRGLLGQLTKLLGTVQLLVEYRGVQYDIKCEVLDGLNVPNILSEMDSVLTDIYLFPKVVYLTC